MKSKRYHTTGEIPNRADVVYVARPVDRAFAELLADIDRSRIPVLYGCRQSGKTSLVIRLLEALQTSGSVAFLDLRDVLPHGSREPADSDFLSKFCMAIATALGSADPFVEWWSHQAHKLRTVETTTTLLKKFLTDIVLNDSGRKVTIIVDEIDRVLAFGRTWEFLLDATFDVVNRVEFDRLRFAFVGLNRPVDLVRDGDIAKYQHFEHLRIGDFDADDPTVIGSFAEGLGHIEELDRRRAVASIVLRFTSGQPFLTSFILDRIYNQKLDTLRAVEDEIANLIDVWRFGKGRRPGERPVHFDQPEKILFEFRTEALGALDAYNSIIDGRSDDPPSISIRNVLLGAGLTVETENGFRTRSPVYQRVFDKDWLDGVRNRLILADTGSPRRRSQQVTLPRVLVLNIGGTLGMDVDPEGHLIEADNAADFFAKVPFLEDVIVPIVETPLKRATDGANIVPPNWVAIARTIYEYRDKDISGVLVVAGTDTMAYAASAVAFSLGQGLRFPVVFTGAQAPVTKRHGDAQANMLRAAFVATQGERLPEVVVAFNDLVLRAVRTEKVDDFRFSAFAAPSEGPLAVIGETLQFQLPVRSGGLVGEWNLAPAFEEQVLKISQYPGLNVKYILRNLESGDVRGLLIESLGLGNIPVVEGYSLIPAIQKAQDLRIPVLITGRYPIQPEFIEFYKPASQPLQLGAISAGDMAPPAALTKFMWAIAQVDAAVQRRDLPPNRRLEQVKKIMETNLLGEVGTSRSRKQ